MTTTLFTGGLTNSSLALPVIPLASSSDAEKAAAFVGSRNIATGQSASTRDSTLAHNWPGAAHIIRDELTGTTTVSYKINYKEDSLITNEEVIYQVQDGHPADANVNATIELLLFHNGQRITWKGNTVIKSDRDYFHYEHTRQLYLNNQLMREKEWKEAIKRDFQ